MSPSERFEELTSDYLAKSCWSRSQYVAQSISVIAFFWSEYQAILAEND